MMSMIDHAAAGAAANEAFAPAATGGNGALAAAASDSQAAAPTLDAELRAVWDRNHPRRNNDGTFAARTEEGEGAAAGQDGGRRDPADEHKDTNREPAARDASAKEPADPAKANAGVYAPESWSADQKARWNAVPPDVQAYIAKREAEALQTISRAGEHLRALQQQVSAEAPLRQLVESHKESFARRGVAPAQGIAALLEAQRKLDQDPAAGLIHIGWQYGMDLRPFFQSQKPDPQRPQQGQSPVADPILSELTADMRKLAGQVQAQQGVLDAQRKAEQDALAAELQRDIAALQDRPHFDELRPLMSALMIQGQAANLADAYDMAINANPSTRQSVQQSQRVQDEARRQAEAQARADEARRAAAVNVRSGQPASQVKPGTIDETLNEIARRRYG
jgi:hypothetical protein